MANAVETKATLIGTLWPDRTSRALRWITLMIIGSAFSLANAICGSHLLSTNMQPPWAVL